MNVLLLRFNVTWTSYISGISAISTSSQRAGVMRTHVSTCFSACLQRMPGVVKRIVNSAFHSSVEYSQLEYMWKSHYIFCLLSLRFFHGHNVPVGCLLTSQTLALCSSWLYFTVEWMIRGVNTTLYNARVIPRQTSIVDIGAASATVE